jgi:hypothetical protein
MPDPSRSRGNRSAFIPADRSLLDLLFAPLEIVGRQIDQLTNYCVSGSEKALVGVTGCESLVDLGAKRHQWARMGSSYGWDPKDLYERYAKVEEALENVRHRSSRWRSFEPIFVEGEAVPGPIDSAIPVVHGPLYLRVPEAENVAVPFDFRECLIATAELCLSTNAIKAPIGFVDAVFFDEQDARPVAHHPDGCQSRERPEIIDPIELERIVLTDAEKNIFRVIVDTDDPLIRPEVAKRSGQTARTVGKIAAKLKKLGLIDNKPRVGYFSTPKGDDYFAAKFCK